MLNYILRRVLLMVPTLFGILLVNFLIIQAAPGGPIERMLVNIKGIEGGSLESGSGGGAELTSTQSLSGTNSLSGAQSKYAGAQGLDPEFIAKLEKQYGFDKPAHERFWIMIKSYLTFDLGSSYFKDATVISLIKQKLPVSISLGLWTTLLIYLISIPLGIRKAVRDGQTFDIWTSWVVIVGYSIPGFLLAIFLIVFLAGGSYWQIFPLRGLVSENWNTLPLFSKITDYFWHLALPVFASVLSGFASLTMLTKNAFLEEMNKQYVFTARAKGLSQNRVLYGHVFRNAMMIVISSFPAIFIALFFTSSILIEVIFSLDGLGLLGFEAVTGRDYPVVFGSLFIFTLLGLVIHLLSDIAYMFVDPRVDFEKREV